jgi:hypothetical protein
MTTGLKYHTKEADQHKKKMKEKPKHAKESDHWLNQTPLPITTQIYWNSEMKTNSRKSVLKTRQILFLSI